MTGRLPLVACVFFVAGSLFAVVVWLLAGDGAWGPPDIERTSVKVHEVRVDSSSDNLLNLVVGSCNGGPTGRLISGTEGLEIEVMAFVDRDNGPECQDLFTVGVPETAGDPFPTELLDRHTGQTVAIQAAN